MLVADANLLELQKREESKPSQAKQSDEQRKKKKKKKRPAVGHSEPS
jgi:hypothetical protein